MHPLPTARPEPEPMLLCKAWATIELLALSWLCKAWATIELCKAWATIELLALSFSAMPKVSTWSAGTACYALSTWCAGTACYALSTWSAGTACCALSTWSAGTACYALLDGRIDSAALKAHGKNGLLGLDLYSLISLPQSLAAMLPFHRLWAGGRANLVPRAALALRLRPCIAIHAKTCPLPFWACGALLRGACGAWLRGRVAQGLNLQSLQAQESNVSYYWQVARESAMGQVLSQLHIIPKIPGNSMACHLFRTWPLLHKPPMASVGSSPEGFSWSFSSLEVIFVS